MGDWEKFNETSLPEKEDFHSHLNMEDITDADYTHTKRVSKDFEIKNLGKYHDLYVQSDTLFLADVPENFWDVCLEIYELWSCLFSFHTRFSMANSFKNTKVELDLLTYIVMLLMIENGMKGAMWHSIYQYAKADNK